MDVKRERAKTINGREDWFTGTVFLDPIVVAPSRLRATSVHFTPGARTRWHTHPEGQTLHVLEGMGRAQARGGPVHELHAGDTVMIPPGEVHWHGAAPENFMTHLALQDTNDAGVDVEWGEPVTDEEYLAPPG